MSSLNGFPGTEKDFFRRHEQLLFFCICLVAMLPLVGLGRCDLEKDEGMWALRALAVADHDAWMDQTEYSINGLYSSSYPPLCIWAMGLSMKVLGPTPAAARLPSAIFGLATVIVIFYIARKTYGFRPAVLAAVAFGLCHKYLAYAQTAEMDVAYVFWVTLALYLYMRYQRQSGRPMVILPLAGVAMGLAFLCKPFLGLYVPLTLLPYLIYMAIFQRYGWKRVISDLLLLGLCALAVAAPWHMFMHGKYPTTELPGERGFLEWILGRHILERAASPIEGHSSGWGPLFYANTMVLYLPFTVALGVMGLGETLRTLSHKMLYRLPRLGDAEVPAAGRVPLSVDDRMRLLILIWLLVTFLVPTCFGTKIAKYLLPCLVPFSILVGVALDRVYRGATSNETNVSCFAWLVLTVVYWQTHGAHHALEASLGALWDWRPLNAGELAQLYLDGIWSLLRVMGAGVIAFAVGVGAWLLRNRLPADHVAVGRFVLPLVLGPMLVVALWRVGLEPTYAPGRGHPYPLAAEEAFQGAREAARELDRSREQGIHYQQADRILVLGHWRDNFQMAFYLRGANYGIAWDGGTPPRLSRIERQSEGWVRLDQGLEQQPIRLEDAFKEVEEEVAEAQRDQESILVVLALYDRPLAHQSQDVQILMGTLQKSYNLLVLHHDARGWGYAILYRDFGE